MGRYLYTFVLLWLIIFTIGFYFKILLLFPLLLVTLIYIIYKYRTKALILPLILLLAILFLLNFKEINQSYHHSAKVYKVFQNSLLVKENGKKYFLMGKEGNFIPGDTITFTCKYKLVDSSNGSFGIYVKSIGADAIGYANDITITSRDHTIRGNIFNNFINNSGFYSQNVLALLYGYKTEYNGYFLDQIYKIGLAHLFVISGFHISLFFFGLENIIKRFTKKGYLSTYISIFVVVIFLYLIYFPITAIRALITISLIKTHRYNRIDSLSICGLAFFVINPFIMISNSMILSFGITFVIYIINPNKNKLSDYILLSVMAFFVAMPTIATWNSEFNLLSPLLVIIFSPLASFSYILALILLPFHFLWWIGDIYFFLFNWLTIILSNIYIPFQVGELNLFKQYYLTLLTIFYIFMMRDHKTTLLNSMLSLSIIFYII